ncbi:PREDICTED: reverse mRNAase [Prunus dulcis]|uniref:PREDICTED: reverse mRNAase n=2 Tax=Prunus dulcis TaxID=3755 RepID=A0A5E4GBA9_PRUDU|nr:PREDICTED: reverse mRNAase [Prunus dulcis]
MKYMCTWKEKSWTVSLFWHYTVTGKYSVKSGYWLSQSKISRQHGDVSGSANSMDLLWSSIWSLRVPNKLKVGTFKELYRYVSSVLTNDELVFFVFLSWGLWSSRNDLLHSGQITSYLSLLAHTRKLVLKYQRAIVLMSSHVPATNIVRYWSPPNDNFVKINVDGAVNLLIGFRGLGVVIRDSMGDLMLAACKGLHGVFSPKATQLYATIMRLLIASQMGHRSIILEMDTKEIIMNLQTYEQSWSVEGALVNEVRGLFNRFDHISCYLLLRSVTKLLIYWLSRRSCLRTFKCG